MFVLSLGKVWVTIIQEVRGEDLGKVIKSLHRRGVYSATVAVSGERGGFTITVNANKSPIDLEEVLVEDGLMEKTEEVKL